MALALSGLFATRALRHSPASPTRHDEAILAFEASDRREPPPRGAIVLAGSSTFTKWNDTMGADLAPLTVIPRGFGGSTMRDLLFYADRIVVAYQPRAVVIYEGDNDLAEGLGPEAIRDTFLELARRLRQKLPAVRVYVVAVKPSPSRWGLWPAARRLNELLRVACVADASSRLHFVDITLAMLDADGGPKRDIFLTDNLHLNRAGYEILARTLGAPLKERELAEERSVTTARDAR